MALRQLEYDGMTITAAAFELAGTGRFVVALSIARSMTAGVHCNAKLFEPPSDDGLFDNVDEALELAIAFGRAIIDGEIPGHSVGDL
jgi:hypothetical protein